MTVLSIGAFVWVGSWLVCLAAGVWLAGAAAAVVLAGGAVAYAVGECIYSS